MMSRPGAELKLIFHDIGFNLIKMLLKLIKNYLLKSKTYEVYTDGSHKGKWGSWAYIVLYNGVIIKEASGRTAKTDSTRMELQAVIQALSFLPPGSNANLYSDSGILIQGMTKKIAKWKENDWLSKNKAKIPNADQFNSLDKLATKINVKWNWVKAHHGNHFNERCDQLCTKTRLKTN